MMKKYIYASVKKNEVQQYRVVRYGVLYVVGDRALSVEEPSRMEDKVASFCGGAFMAQFGEPSPFSIPQMGSALSASWPSKVKAGIMPLTSITTTDVPSIRVHSGTIPPSMIA
jgi:hypothetical protein